jgi:(R,R)-butanediol dehydrogenase / meso-butanediol dehydrogenase / diacetyl reductase
MTGVRWHGRRDVRVDRIPTPGAPAPGHVQVAVAWCGICGSDLHEYRAGPFLIPVAPHPTTGCRAPLVLGHEIAGHVVSVGDGVDEVAIGGLVVLNALLPCGACGPCGRAAPHLCTRLGHLGFSADGGLAELLNVPVEMVVPVPPGVPSDVAALAEPFAVAMHAVRVAGEPSGSDCVVLGAGTIGLCVASVLRADGNRVTIHDVAAPRREHGAALGFATGHPDDAPHAPLVFECSGAPAGVRRAVSIAEAGGTVVLTGIPESDVAVDVADVVIREVRLLGTMSHLRDRDLRPAAAHVAAHVDEAARLITARVPLEDTVTHGLKVLDGPDRSRHAKILVRVGG